MKIIFWHGEIFEFPQFFFCLKILFNVNGKATVVTGTPLVLLGTTLSYILSYSLVAGVSFYIL